MGHIESSLTLNASVEAVWNALNDIDNTAKWVVGLENAEIVSTGDYGQGSIYRDYNRLGPFLQMSVWHVTVFTPMSLQVHVSESSLLPSTMTLTLSPLSDGVAVKMMVDYQFLPNLGVIGRMLETILMNHMLKSVLGQNLAGLNKYLQQKSIQVPADIAI